MQGGRAGGVRENITYPYGGLGGAAGSCPDDEDDEASGTSGNEGEKGIGGKGETGRGGIAVEDGTRDEGHGAGGAGGRAPTATGANGGNGAVIVEREQRRADRHRHRSDRVVVAGHAGVPGPADRFAAGPCV